MELLNEQNSELNQIFHDVCIMVLSQVKISLDVFANSFGEHIWDDEEMDVDQQVIGLALMGFYFCPMESSKKPSVDAAFINKVFSEAKSVIERADLS